MTPEEQRDAAIRRQGELVKANMEAGERIAELVVEVGRLTKEPPDMYQYRLQARAEIEAHVRETVANELAEVRRDVVRHRAQAEKWCKRAGAWESEAKKLHGVLNHARHMLKHGAPDEKVRGWIRHGLDLAVERYRELKRRIKREGG